MFYLFLVYLESRLMLIKLSSPNFFPMCQEQVAYISVKLLFIYDQ